MDRRSLTIVAPALLGLLATGAVIGASILSLSEKVPSPFYPHSYNQKVNAWLESGLLTIERGKGRFVASVSDEKLSAEEKAWLGLSFLPSDIRRFNGDPGKGIPPSRGIFLQREGQWKINPYQHLSAPFSFLRRRWTGGIWFRAPAVGAALWSDERTIVFARPEPGELPIKPGRYAILDLAASAPGAAPGAAPAVLTCKGLAVTYGDRTRNLAEFFFLGDDVVINVRDERLQVWLEGQRLRIGQMAVLRDGDRLLFEKPAANQRPVVQAFLFRQTTAGATAASVTGSLSAIQLINGRQERHSRAAQLDFAPTLASAIEKLYSQQTTANEKLDVYLTLDESLHVNLTRGLTDWMRTRRLTKAAGVTLLDLRTGELLALASYPSPALAERLAKTKRRRRQLRRNHNFHLHPIGSAGKVFLATAALSARPEIATLERRCHPSTHDFRHVLDIELPTNLVKEGDGFIANPPAICRGSQWFGFLPFLTSSSNAYMVDLFTLSLSGALEGAQCRKRAPDKNCRWRIRTERGLAYYDEGFDHSLYLTPERLNVIGLEGLPTFRELRRIFGIRTSLVLDGVDPGYDLRLWKPLTDRILTGEQRPISLYSDEVTPERVNLRANTIQNLRQDYVSFLLGGAANEWTNVQLAEALARLAMNRPVEAQLVHRLEVDGRVIENPKLVENARPTAPLIAPDIRSLVLRGMHAVVQKGTAKKAFGPKGLKTVERVLPGNGATLRLYGKTGTLKDKKRPTSVFLFILAAEKKGEILGGISGAIYIDSPNGGAFAAFLARHLLEKVVRPYLKAAKFVR